MAGFLVQVRIIMIVEKIIVGPLASNCYIVVDDVVPEGIIIDPGDEAGAILERVGELGIGIKYILLTHGHLDHIAATADIKEATGARMVVHTEEADGLNDKTLGLFTGETLPKVPRSDWWLRGWESIEFGSLSFTVLHTPGHSPGGICLLGEGALFSGDTLFYRGIGRSDLPGGDLEKLLQSIHTRLLILPDETVVYPGHGPQTNIGDERRSNPFLQDQPEF
jgi:glyoxylase-like metal-dependent hydrolase (beta-lactamase superfamily II)